MGIEILKDLTGVVVGRKWATMGLIECESIGRDSVLRGLYTGEQILMGEWLDGCSKTEVENEPAYIHLFLVSTLAAETIGCAIRHSPQSDLASSATLPSKVPFRSMSFLASFTISPRPRLGQSWRR